METTFSFLPQNPEVNRFILFGAMLLAGLIGGEMVARTRKLPRITGFIMLGFVLGPSVLGVLTPELLDMSRIFVDIALSIILFKIATYINIRHIRRNFPIFQAALLESGMAFALIASGLILFGFPLLPSFMAGAIGMSSSPTVILLVTRELGAEGKLTDLVIKLVALNNVFSFIVYISLLPILHSSNQAGIVTIILQPLYQFFGAVVLAWILSKISIYVLRLVGSNTNNIFPLFIGTIILGLGMAQWLKFSALLTVMALGIFVFNRQNPGSLSEAKNNLYAKAKVQDDLFNNGQIFYVLLFVVAGANLHFEELMDIGWLALLFVALRAVGKILGCLLGSRSLSLGLRESVQAGLMLTPMAGLAIGLTQTTQNLYPEFSHQLATLMLAAIAVLETIGPVVTEYTLKRSGEVPADSPVMR